MSYHIWLLVSILFQKPSCRLIYVYECFASCVYMYHMHVRRSTKSESGLWSLETGVMGSCEPTWVLWTKLRSPERAISALNLWAISPTPSDVHLKIIFIYLLCVWVHACFLWREWRSEDTCETQFSPSAMSDPRIELRLSDLAASAFACRIPHWPLLYILWDTNCVFFFAGTCNWPFLFTIFGELR